MRENPTEVVVGGVVLAAALGFLFYTTQATGFGSTPGDYELHANFRSVEGVNVGTEIRLAGVSVGTVTGVELNAETYRAETVLSIDDGIQIPDDSSVAVASEGLLGGTFVELTPGGSWDYFAPGDLITDTQGAISIVQMLIQFAAGGGEDPAATDPAQ